MKSKMTHIFLIIIIILLVLLIISVYFLITRSMPNDDGSVIVTIGT